MSYPGTPKGQSNLIPMPKLSVNAMPSTPRMTIAPFMSSRTSQEDNTERREKVKEVLNSYKAQLQLLKKDERSMFEFDGRVRENKERLYKQLEEILSLYNFNVNLISQDQSDSATKIEAVLHTHKSTSILMCIAVILSRFPFSFIKAIDLSGVTICKNMFLKKEGFESVYNSRVMGNAIFMTDGHNSYSKVEKHFYKIILYHVEKKMPSIHEEWPTNDRSPRAGSFSEKSKFASFDKTKPCINPITLNPNLMSSFGTHKRSGSGSGSGSNTPKGVNLDDLKMKEKIETFYKIIAVPKEVLDSTNQKLQFRAAFIKEKLEELDPLGIDKDWWSYLVSLDMKFIEETLEYVFSKIVSS